MTIHMHVATRPVAAYACSANDSRGRLFPEPECSLRSVYQRDRDRIVHCSAFRRLTYKTQVFVFHEGDHYRNRLTHSLEVAQIARTLASILGLNEDLAEAIALAHDLGHPPFGHAGEDALREVMEFCGGFDHNAQSLRVVTRLEKRYAAFRGLNLSWEMLEGLAKHNGPLLQAGGQPIARFAESGLPETITAYNAAHDLGLSTYASAEAQVASLADDVAYNNHDLDDGLRAGLIPLEKLRKLPRVGGYVADVEKQYGQLSVSTLIYEVNRRLISAMVRDLAQETEGRIAGLSPKTADDIRNAGAPVVAFSEVMKRDMADLRAFLFEEFYFHPRITEIMDGARTIVRDLFRHFMEHPDALPEDWRGGAGDGERGRVIGDFVAGMTDRLALETHQRLFDATPRLR